ncbi:MCE family protein [Aldersonia kunmingensis]|uniref:MCE family protein n=1 Tax=Aldersonia kunmingensis TaxID=408066 RepID=UPI0009FF856F|nr:MCE family protein [Aldersonia kunmingensis]
MSARSNTWIPSRVDRRVRLAVAGCAVVATVSGCGWQGVNAMTLPGAVGNGGGATVYQAEIANVGTLESNSPVLIDDVVVGHVGPMKVDGWHANVEFTVEPGVIVPANAVATVGQTSLLGSMHLALDPPVGQKPEGTLAPGSTIPLDHSGTYPSTEQTLASLSVVLNAGGLGQIGEIIENLNDALNGREGSIRDLLTRLDTLMGTLDSQRGEIVATIDGLKRLSATFAGQRDVLDEALVKLPPALDVLLQERPNLTTALDKLRVFSDSATSVVNDVQSDLVEDLNNLEPTLAALADVGPKINDAVAFVAAFPYGQEGLDKFIKGDYLNLDAHVDLTVPRLQKTLLLGTPWGNPNAVIQAAVGDPGYEAQQAQHTNDPLRAPVAPPAAPPNGGQR